MFVTNRVELYLLEEDDINYYLVCQNDRTKYFLLGPKRCNTHLDTYRVSE